MLRAKFFECESVHPREDFLSLKLPYRTIHTIYLVLRLRSLSLQLPLCNIARPSISRRPHLYAKLVATVSSTTAASSGHDNHRGKDVESILC